MSTQTKKFMPYYNAYANLAWAILRSGRDDESFVQSEWADSLRELCRLDDEMYGDRNLRITRGKIEVVGS